MNWISEDCGGKISALNSGKKIHEFQYHPMERNWAMAATWTTCTEFSNGEPCRIFKELYMTKDLWKNWIYMEDYVYDFAWVYSKFVDEKALFDKIPKERILIT